MIMFHTLNLILTLQVLQLPMSGNAVNLAFRIPARKNAPKTGENEKETYQIYTFSGSVIIIIIKESITFLS